MASRISSKPFADAVVRSSSRPRTGFPPAPSVFSTSSTSRSPFSRSNSRSFSHTNSCLSQSQKEKPLPSSLTSSWSPSNSGRGISSSSSRTSRATEDGKPTEDALEYARELQASTPAAEHGPGGTPVPQRRLPRWAATPAAMAAPFSVRKNAPANRFAVNEDPARLDRAYETVFGEGGSALLPDEVKWLAVTHKSFDQGRRGFNDRLAFLGKRIVDLQTSLAILAQPASPLASAVNKAPKEGEEEKAAATGEEGGSSASSDEIVNDREPFRHPAMDILPKLDRDVRSQHTDPRRISGLAREFGLDKVVRWKPRKATDLVWSGQSPVLIQALYAMVGALALHKGGDVAVKAVRARILPRIGLDV